MSRSQRPHGTEVDGLLLELEDGLAADPRLLLDPGFLRPLHRDLRERLGADEAQAVLLRAGFFHGLCHALAATEAPGSRAEQERLPGPLLPMGLARRESPTGVWEVAGRWPDPLEARAVRAARIELREPGCLLSAGYTSGWLSGVWERDVLALEQSCVAQGAPACRFLAREQEVWRASGDARAQRLLDQLPFAALWAVASQSVERSSRARTLGAIDPESPAVHVWGPVMVVPYAGDHTAAEVESVVRDPGARQVSVVVLDLGGAILDAGFGAVSLERALEAIEASGAETILTGVSPLSEEVVATLERTHLVLRKDLAEAVAAAFQIAESQRNPA